MSSQATVEKVEERWSATTIQTAFVFDITSISVSSAISIHLPLLHLGWTFALSLTPELQERPVKKGSKQIKRYTGNWIPAVFSFRQHGSAICWGNTSICAQLSLGKEFTPHDVMGSNSTPLGTMNFVLAHTSALKLPLTMPHTISSLQPDKIWLSVTISECPLVGGLFQVRAGLVNEAEIRAKDPGTVSPAEWYLGSITWDRTNLRREILSLLYPFHF
ncbi:hypothetical protein OG21DRAFT_1492076 [Imleria badia]|nr:hypothetical protein OG21DRAFT_1492076 [Imleria badia]